MATETTPCAPSKQSMVDYTADELPPPYDLNAPQSRIFWRNYKKGQDAHCFADGACRVMCFPCLACGATVGCPWCVLCSIVNDDECTRKGSACEGCTPYSCCCIYDRLDHCLPKCSGACVGCVKFPGDRTDEEVAKMRWVRERIRSLLCCCCDACEWLFNTPCCTCIRECICNLKENCRRCGHGACVCGELVARRMCCCPPKQEIV